MSAVGARSNLLNVLFCVFPYEILDSGVDASVTKHVNIEAINY